MRNVIKYLGVFIVLLGTLHSCQEQDDTPTITFGYVLWEEDVAMTNVAKVLLEENEYKVKYRTADIQPIFQRLLPRGKIDVFMDTWMPVTHKHYLKKNGDTFENLGVNYEKAKTGLIVPKYVPINSIEELNEHRDKFHRTINGIDIGAGIMQRTEEAVEQYDLEIELEPSTNFAMLTTLQKAIAAKEWVVLTGWTPHSMFSEFDIKFLADPKNVYGEGEDIQTVAREGFSEDYPFVAELLRNIKFTEKEMSSLLQTIEEAKDEFQGAENWVKAHRILVDEWIPERSLKE